MLGGERVDFCQQLEIAIKAPRLEKSHKVMNLPNNSGLPPLCLFIRFAVACVYFHLNDATLCSITLGGQIKFPWAIKKSVPLTVEEYNNTSSLQIDTLHCKDRTENG